MPRLPVKGPVVIPFCAEIKLHWAAGTRRFTNVLHGAHTSGAAIPSNDPETVFLAIKAATSTTAWLALCSASLELTGVSIKNLNAANQPEVPSVSAAVLGTAAGPSVAANTAMVVTLKTAQSGQGFRGRVYLMGMAQTTLQDAFTFTSAAGQAAISFVTGVNGALTTSGYPLVVAQRALNAGTHHDGSPWAARPAGTVPVTTVSIVNARVDSQRRRAGR